ncbi:MAG: hypothetical protein R3C53_01635 [Pirellulaceae bacterium]
MKSKLLLLIAFGFWLPTALQAEDRVYPKTGATASGKITKLLPGGVVISVRGKDQNYAIDDVLKVSFDGEPKGLERGRDQVIQGQYEQALEELKKLSPAGIDDPRIVEDIVFYRSFCDGKLGLAGSGDKQAAINGLIALAKRNRNTHHLYNLSEMLGELHLAIGKPADAAIYFNLMTSAEGAETKAKGLYRLGEVELAQGKANEAKLRFEQLSATASNSPEMIRIKNLAEIGLAICLNEQGESQQALDKLNAMVQKYDSTDQGLFARINNAKGACYQKLDKPQQALLSYLQTDLLFFTEPEAHAESLYHLKNLWPTNGNPSRAADAQARLVSRYASSTWANKP